MPVFLSKELRELLSQLNIDAVQMGRVCKRCASVCYSDICNTCEAMAYARGDAFVSTCTSCKRRFVTADPQRGLCCFCMKRTGENNGRNRRADPQAPRSSFGAAHQGTGRAAAFTAERARPALKDTRIRTGEIIAWRAWRIVYYGSGRYLLKSMAVDCIWQPGEEVSVNSVLEQCGYRDQWDRIPPGIGAGIHAFKGLTEAMRQYREGDTVYGTVALWGEVIEHEIGYRAEFGRVNTLDHYGNMDQNELWMLRRIAEIYGVAGKSYKDFNVE